MSPLTQNGMEDMDEPPSEKEEEVLILVDPANGFNMLSQLGMIWTLWHHCPRLLRFAFNCYRHQARLVYR